jgi:hypothetical protein
LRTFARIVYSGVATVMLDRKSKERRATSSVIARRVSTQTPRGRAVAAERGEAAVTR